MNISKTILVLTIVIIISSEYYSQNNGILRGVVKDSLSSEVLPYSNIMIKELEAGVSSDNRGFFVIPSLDAPKVYTIFVSYVGYEVKELKVKVEVSKITEIEIFLRKSSYELETVQKVEQLSGELNKSKISKMIITPKDLENLPMSIESDLLRTISVLPGVQNTGDVSVKYSVRGGESNQNLVLLDGIPVYYPFHAIGLLGVIEPDVINSVQFYKGGFPSSQGGALSSILNISTNDGNTNFHLAKASLSLLSVKGMIEGPIPNGSFYFTGRKSISNNILKKFLDEKELPVNFHDYSFKINYRNPDFFDGTKFSLIHLSSEDKLLYSNPVVPDYTWSNNIWGLKIFTVGKIPFFLDLDIGISTYKNQLDNKESSAKPKLNELSDFSISSDFLYIMDSKDEFEIGIDLKAVTSKLFLVNRLDFPTDVGSSEIGAQAYVNYNLRRFNNIEFNTGARINLSDLSAKGNFIEPRVSISSQLTPLLSVKGAYGIYQQDITTIVDEREVLSLFEPIVIIPSYLTKAKAEHYAAGFSLSASNDLIVDIEGYYKNIISSPTLNENKTVFAEPDMINSIGEAYGAEFMFTYTPKPFSVMIGYTLSWAFKEVNGKTYRPKYDSRHNLNISVSWSLPYNFRLSTSWRYNSGYPFTQLAGYYDIISFNQLLSDYDIYGILNPVKLFGNKNSVLLPDYHRLDLSLSKRFELGFTKMNFDLSAINVYDRDNIYYFEQNTGKRVNMLPFLLTGTISIEL
jgi:hypothetical protein